MKVTGFKSRVQLSEEQLEHIERRPGFSVTPVLAVAIWIASMLAATAIQVSWAPFGASDENETELTSSPSVPDRAKTQPPRAARARAVAPESPPDREGEKRGTENESAAVASPSIPSAADATPEAPRDRKIRGSYAGAREDWLAGW